MLLDYFFPKSTLEQYSQTILNIRNGICLFVSSFSLYTICTYNSELLKYNLYLIAAHCFTDLLFCTPDLLFHHFCAITLIILNLNYSINENVMIENKSVISGEISTFFLVFAQYLSNTHNLVLHQLNQICFILSFFYTRIYLFSKYLIYNKQLYDTFFPNSIIDLKYCIYHIALYSLYFLNIYWFSIIIKKVVKQLPKISIIDCEYILQYTYFCPVFYALYVYSNYNMISLHLINPVYYYDIGGILYLSYTSYIYHRHLMKQLIKNNSNMSFNSIETAKDVWLYLHDIIAINIRSVLCIITNTITILSCNKDNSISNTLCILSILNHIITTFYYIKYILRLDSFAYINNEKQISNTINYLIGIPIFVDSMIIFYNETDFYNRINILVITLLIYLIVSIKPFYHMNHLALHIVLIFEAMILCQANINNYTNTKYTNKTLY